MKIAIVGAGAAGLSLGVMLQDNHEVTLFEKDSQAGGLCRSTKKYGYCYDRGPHILGGIPEAVQWIVDSTGLEFVEGKTNNCGWKTSAGYVPHPFTEAEGFAYMHKMWKMDPSKLSVGGLKAQKDRKLGGVPTFLYPKTGGYQAITDAWVKQLDGKIRYNTEYDFSEKHDRVIWTAPRPERSLRYNTLDIATALCWGVNPGYTAIYLPDDSTPFHRLSFPKSFSENNAPKDGFVVQAERTFHGKKDSIRDLGYELCKLLGRMNLVASDSYQSISVERVPFAYPVPLADTDPIASRRTPDNLIYHGRTGGFVYKNIDGVVADSIALAQELNK